MAFLTWFGGAGYVLRVYASLLGFLSVAAATVVGLVGEVLIVASLSVLVILMIFLIVARMYRKVGPNQALIVYGFGGTRIVQGGGAIVLPLVQSCQELSLELMSFDVSPEQDLYTKQGVAVTVEADYDAAVKKAQAQADKAYEIQTNVMQWTRSPSSPRATGPWGRTRSRRTWRRWSLRCPLSSRRWPG